MNDEVKWHSNLPAEILANETVQNAPDLATFVKQALDTASMVGSSIRIPGPDAGEETVSDFHKKLVEKVPGMYYMPGEDDTDAKTALYQKLGKPSNPEGYEISAPEGADEAGKKLSAQFVTWANELNLTKEQAQGIHAKFNEARGTEVEAFQQFNKDSKVFLNAEWGAMYDQKMKGVTALVDKTDAPDHFKEAIKSGDIDGPTLKWLSTIADGLMSSKPEILDQPPGSEELMTPAEAQAQIAEIMARKEFFIEGPIQKELVNKILKLQVLAHPGIDTGPPQRAGFSVMEE